MTHKTVARKHLWASTLLLAAIALGLINACDDLVTEVREVTIAGHPTAEFALDSGFSDSGCVPMTVRFVDKSDGPRDEWLWKFGDGDSATEQNPTHVYNTQGVFDVSLTIKDSATGGVDTEVKKRFLVVGTSVVGFSPDTNNVCIGEPITFTPVVGAVSSYSWDFGDGFSSTDSVPAHSYLDTGTFEVKLSVQGVCGVDSAKDTVFIRSCPLVVMQSDSISTGCVPFTAYFSESSDPGPGVAILMRIWDWGDGAIDTISTVNISTATHVYTVPDSYTVKLTIVNTDSVSRSDSLIDIVTVTDPVAAGFTSINASTGCFSPTQQFLVHFTDTSTGTIIQRYWDFGDGTFDSTNNPQPLHAYDTGVYTVKLKVVGKCGLTQFTDSVIATDFVGLSPAPIQSAPFTITTDTTDPSGLTIDIADNSTGSIVSRSWVFGDGTTSQSNIALFNKSYPLPGQYTISLTNTNFCGQVTIDTTITLPLP